MSEIKFDPKQSVAVPDFGAVIAGDQQPQIMANNGSLDHSSASKELKNWNPRSTTGDQNLLKNRQREVGRAQDLVETNGHVSGAIQKICDKMIGTGLKLDYQPNARALGLDPDDPKLEAFIEDAEAMWRVDSENVEFGFDARGRVDLAGQQVQEFYPYFIQGNSLTLARWMRGADMVGRNFSTAFEVIHPDRLSTPMTKIYDDKVDFGIEKGKYGRAVAYHIADCHPADRKFKAGGPKWERVPAYVKGTTRRQVIHYYYIKDSSTTVGRSVLGTIVERLKKMDIAEDSALMAYIINSMFSFFITSPYDDTFLAQKMGGTGVAGELDSDGLGAYQDGRASYHDKINFELGGVSPTFLFPGETPNFMDANRPVAAHNDFLDGMKEGAAAHMNMSMPEFTQNYSKVNYSGLRGAVNETWQTIIRGRSNFAKGTQSPKFALWLEEKLMRGDLTLPPSPVGFYENRAAWCQCNWIGPGRGYIDPFKEIMAAEKRLSLGLTTVKQETTEQGGNMEENMAQIARERRAYQAQGREHPAFVSTRELVAEEGHINAEDDPDAEDEKEEGNQDDD